MQHNPESLTGKEAVIVRGAVVLVDRKPLLGPAFTAPAVDIPAACPVAVAVKSLLGPAFHAARLDK